MAGDGINQNKGGVVFHWRRINKYIQPIGISDRPSLFLGLGCKPLKDVIFHPTTINVSVGDINCQQLRRLFAYLDWAQEGIYIKVIPKRITPIEIKDNLLNLYNDYGEIEAVKDIEAVQ